MEKLTPNALKLWQKVEADAERLFTGKFYLRELVDFITSLTRLAQKLLNISGIEKRKVVTEIVLYVIEKYGFIPALIAFIPMPFWLKPFTGTILNAVVPLIVSVIVSLWKD